MKIFAIFFYKILAKYSPKRTKLHHFLMPRAAWRPAPCKYPHFSKNNFEPPPPK